MSLLQAAKCGCKSILRSAGRTSSQQPSLAHKNTQAWTEQSPSLPIWPSFDFACKRGGREWLCNVLLALVQFCASPGTQASPSPPPHFCFIYEYVARIPMSYLFWAPSFSHRGLVAGWLRVQSLQWEEKKTAKEFFSTFFFMFHSFLSVSPPGLLPSTAPSNLPASPSLLGPPSPLYVTRSLKLKLRRVL